MAQETEGVHATDGGIAIDFQDADLRLVLTALAEAGQLNVVFSDLPGIRITLRTGQPIPVEEVLPLLRTVAESHGLQVLKEDGFVRVEQAPADAQVLDQRVANVASTGETRLHIYELKHVRADRLAGTLRAVFGGDSRIGLGSRVQRPLSERLREQGVAPYQMEDAPAPAQPESLGENTAGIAGQMEGEVQIVPDATTNSLLVRATPRDWEAIRDAIDQLDLRPMQVLIEVLIAEVRRTEEFDVGVSVDGGGAAGDQDGRSVELRGRSTSELVIEVLQAGGVNLDLAISALAASGRVRILSRPVILAQNNQEARILVGSQRPFVQVFRSLPTDVAVRDQIVQYRDVGTSLAIKPTINSDGYVNLEVVQEVSTATTETQFGAPVISTREASTYLFVRDGQTAVIGGLIEQQRDSSRSGIPLLKDIPGLGVFFGTTRRSLTESELFIFLTPRIISSDEDADQIRSDVEEESEVLPEGIRLFPPLFPVDIIDGVSAPPDSSEGP